MSAFNVPVFSDVATDWHSINWNKVERNVRCLQVRIAKATKCHNWRQVSYLQRFLVRSFSAKALAVKRVTENRGKRTPGIDGELWDNPESKWLAISKLVRKGYKPNPLRRVFIAKPNGKSRPLGIPTMLDRAMQALYLLALEPVSESTADRNSYGFRPMRSTADAIEQLFVVLSRKNSAKWILEADIEGCFDNINHDWLLDNVPMDNVVLRRWLKSGFMDSGKFHETYAGTPQGGIISPVLANMALDGLEDVLESHFGKKNTKASYKTKVNFVRYADDFVISGISKEILELEVLPIVEGFLKQRGLKLSRSKTKVTHVSEGFDFLGQNVRSYKGKLLIKPSAKNLRTFLKKVKLLIKGNKTVKTCDLIDLLNPVITGWANYHSHVVAKKTFNYVDYRIWKMLWQWSRRRHANRRKRWIKEKYFKSSGVRNWVFSDYRRDGSFARLVYASDTPIKRHIKIKGEFNPYDPIYEEYFEKHLERSWVASFKGRDRLLTLWLRQRKRCVCCGHFITKSTGWNIHHIVERVNGGSDNLCNLVLLHPNCHRQLHVR